MSWSARRRLFIVFIILVIIGGGVFWYLSPSIFKAPSCTDGLLNGTEAGVDCGGNCINLCSSQVELPTVLWTRSFPVTDTVYNSIAYIENKNSAAVRTIAYEFRVYDTRGILVARRNGETLVPPLGRYAIVETGIQVGTAIVGRTTFAFDTRPALWEKIPEPIQKLSALTNSAKFDATGLIPKLSASLYNPSPTVTLADTVVAAILYDADDNAVNVSRTIVPVLEPGKSVPIYFTWPRAISVPIVRYDLVPIIDVFHAK